MTTADLLDAIRAHLADFPLPDLSSVYVTRSFSAASVTAQLACHTLPQTGPALLAWADTLTEVTAEAWRVPNGQAVAASCAPSCARSSWASCSTPCPNGSSWPNNTTYPTPSSWNSC